MKKILSLILAAVMLLGIVPLALAEEEPTWWKKFDEPVEVEMTKVIFSDTADKYAKIGETVEDNRWTRLFKEELNIDITYKFVASAGDAYDTKHQLMMATGKIPDIFTVGLSDMFDLQDSGRLWDMTEIWDEYLSPTSKAILTADGGGAYDSCLIDGELYGIPFLTSVYDTWRYLSIRRDWMEALNLEEPKSIDDLLKIMEAFVTQDPDGNGIDDTYALYCDKDMFTQLEGFFWMFGAYPNAFIEKDGRLVYGAMEPEAKEALRTLNMMYEKGWIDPEFTVKSFNQAKEAVTNGKVGCIMGYHWMPFDVNGPMHEFFPEVEWDYYLWPSAEEGVPATVMSQSSLDGVLVVNKDFEHPEVAAYIINLYCELLYSENPTYEYWYWDTASGELTYNIGPFEILDQGINLNPYRDMKKVWAGEMTVEEMNPYSRYYYDMVNTDWAWNTMWGPGEHTAGVVLDFLVNNPEYIVQNAYTGMPTETQQDRGSVLGEIRKTAYIQMITGRIDIDEGFEKMVNDYMNAGGQDIEDEINEWYEENKK